MPGIAEPPPESTPPLDDLIQPFQVEATALRGRLVRLGPALDTILAQHDYPEPVSYLLGEMVALTAVLASALKYRGVFSLQVRTDGPITMLLADIDSNGQVRAYARFDEEQVAKVSDKSLGATPLRKLLGEGYLSWTVDQGPGMEPYQGIVPLDGETLSECAENYFRQSEQLAASLAVGVARISDKDVAAAWRGGAVMVQKIATTGGSEGGTEDRSHQFEDDDGWDRARALVGTIRPDELADPALPARDLLWRVFNEDGVRVFETTPLLAKCRCSREKVHNVLQSFPAEEMVDMVEDGHIYVICEFCGARYDFTEEDARPA